VFSVLADFQVYLARWAKGPVGAVRLASGVLRRRLQQLIASDLDRLKDLVETEIPPS
jgi:hypothetical protein